MGNQPADPPQQLRENLQKISDHLPEYLPASRSSFGSHHSPAICFHAIDSAFSSGNALESENACPAL